ncbi:phosphotransferase [Natronosporangium hydrolyticum]|uniref:Phosphotransferase n=1 Tax=Natronosporangium hydrolyticum TaxID=2811111 RepID=A0A895YQT2_9ACTN|nr:phosphotransferase [Natronosporangium hydrolyticum]QSB16480.1 phosphotransferase [Natronosporangium hydrolyticum]
MAIPIPAAPADVTAGWLTAVLQDSGDLPHGRVSRVDRQVIGADHGFTGVVVRVRLHYRDLADGGAPPASVVVKLPMATRASASAYRSRVSEQAHFDRSSTEVHSYRQLAIAGDTAPWCYFASADPDQRRLVLVLADLDRGLPGDNLAGADPGQATAVLTAIARVHGRHWARPTPDWLPPFITDPGQHQQRYAERVTPFLTRYGAALPAPIVEEVRRLADEYAHVLTELNQAPKTVIHADLHLDNVIFTGSPGDRAAVLLDWQGPRTGPAVVDLASVLGSTLHRDTDGAARSAVLASYAAAVANQGATGYPMAQLWHDFRLALRHRLALVVGWLATVDLDHLAGRERALVTSAIGDGRLVAALTHATAGYRTQS